MLDIEDDFHHYFAQSDLRVSLDACEDTLARLDRAYNTMEEDFVKFRAICMDILLYVKTTMSCPDEFREIARHWASFSEQDELPNTRDLVRDIVAYAGMLRKGKISYGEIT